MNTDFWLKIIKSFFSAHLPWNLHEKATSKSKIEINLNFDGAGTSLYPQTIATVSGTRLGRWRELPDPSSYFRQDLNLRFVLNQRKVVGETRSEDGVWRDVEASLCRSNWTWMDGEVTMVEKPWGQAVSLAWELICQQGRPRVVRWSEGWVGSDPWAPCRKPETDALPSPMWKTWVPSALEHRNRSCLRLQLWTKV